ncbi:MAG: lipid-A-disaccharide synthase N-terminal domain-containing protein [Phycisphaerae bacterium]
MHHVLFSSFGLVITPWKIIGLVGLFTFTARWFVQMIASRLAGRSVMPLAFWYLSASGSVLLIAYFSMGKPDFVGFLSNLFPLTISLYNLRLVRRERRIAAQAIPIEAREVG